MQSASDALEPVMREASAMVIDGHIDEANQKLLATFPESTRTPAQALVLGNVLFKQDPKLSYDLHQRAAKELPNEPDAQLEWAMEQHRAGEYAGAIDNYSKFSAAKPEFAPVYGLCAECVIRTGKTSEAIDMWMKSEKAREGSIEEFESWVCDVHNRDFPDRRRAELLSKLKNGEIDAAEGLVFLDADFPRDWWNHGPEESYLAHDLALLEKADLKDAACRAEILCAAHCALLSARGKGDVAGELRNCGFLFDDHATLPSSGKMLTVMLASARATDAISESDARAKWGEAVLAKAKHSANADLWNAAAHLYLDTDRLEQIDQAGWEASGDERFAASLLVGLAANGKLKLDDARLAKAARQYPQNAEIARIMVSLTAAEGKPLESVLIQAIKAEYSHFSVNNEPGFVTRPIANSLRRYFAALSKESHVK